MTDMDEDDSYDDGMMDDIIVSYDIGVMMDGKWMILYSAI